jgi:hypothetical protein
MQIARFLATPNLEIFGNIFVSSSGCRPIQTLFLAPQAIGIELLALGELPPLWIF